MGAWAERRARGRPTDRLRHLIAAYVGAPSDGTSIQDILSADRLVNPHTLGPAAGRDRKAPGRIEALLTPREQEVVRLLVTGASNREIADALHLSLGTIKAHVREILSKLGVRSRAAAVREALPWIDEAFTQRETVSR